MEDIQVKQLYSGEQKTPFYPKVKLDAVIDPKTNNQTLEEILNNITNQIKAVWQTVYGVDYPNTNNTTALIDSVPEVYAALLNGTGGGSKVSIDNTYSYGGRIATIKIDNVEKDIKVPEDIISALILNTDGKWGLDYNEDSGTLWLLYDDTIIASTNLLGNSDVPIEYQKPQTPTGLTATYSASTNSITLSWNPVKENVTGGSMDEYVGVYEIVRRINGVQEDEEEARITVRDGEVTTWTDTNITDGTYEYKIRARSHASGFISNWSGFTPVITVSSEQGGQGGDDDGNKLIMIFFPNDEVSIGESSVGTYHNILRNLNDQQETYVGNILVLGSSSLLDSINRVKVVDFDGNEQIVNLGAKSASAGGYYKSGTVTINRANKMVAPNNGGVCVVHLYALNSTTGNTVFSSYSTYNFVYPIYTGYVNVTDWDNAISAVDYDANDTVMIHGISLGGEENGYEINNRDFNCNLTSELRSDTSISRMYSQVAIPYNQKYMGYGEITSEANMPSVFRTTDVNAEIVGMSKPFKLVIPFGGIDYWVYTAKQGVVKNLTPTNGITIKAIV